MIDTTRNMLLEMLTPERISRIDEVLDKRTSHLTILLDRIYHPHNIAAVLRSADAFGISTVHLIESEATSRNGISDAQKSPGISLGSEKWVNVIRYSSGHEAVDAIKSNGFKIVSLAPPPLEKMDREKTDTVCVTELPFEEKLCLLFGSELEGIDPDLESESDIQAFIPMYGFVESFNISVACAITLFCSILKKTSPERRTIKLPDEERSQLRDQWIRKSVSRVDEVIAHIENTNKKDIASDGE
jgi:tRNA (guanosine-2'-O-)-methyltransferase